MTDNSLSLREREVEREREREREREMLQVFTKIYIRKFINTCSIATSVYKNLYANMQHIKNMQTPPPLSKARAKIEPSTEARANHEHSPSPSPDADIQLPPSTLTPPQKRSNCAAQIVFLPNERNRAEGSNCLQSRGSLLVARLAYNLMRFRPCSNPGTWTQPFTEHF